MVNFKKTRIPLFRRFVLQNFPFIEQDFDALTDYELICKVVEYLNKVIVSTNATSEQVEILTDAFNELQSYVEHYLDNLDVQEEINNKLDAMVEDGSLAAILLNYTYIQKQFDTLEDAKADETLIDGSLIKCYGHTTRNDGYGGEFRVTTTPTDIVLNNGLYLEKINNYQNNYYGITIVKERYYNTDCYFTEIPLNDSFGEQIDLHLNYKEYSSQNPTKYAQDNNTNVTVNAGLTWITEHGVHEYPFMIGDGEVLSNNDLRNDGNIQDEYTYVCMSADRSITTLPVKTTSLETLQAGNYTQVFDVYYPIIENSQIVDFDEFGTTCKKVAKDLHPRQVMGIKSDKTIIFMTTEGRTGQNIGLTSQQCAEIMLGKGCTDAWNFDGGGSTNLTFKGTKINGNIDDGYTTVRNIPYTLNVKSKEINNNIAEAFSNSGVDKQGLLEYLMPLIPFAKFKNSIDADEIMPETSIYYSNSFTNTPYDEGGWLISIPNPASAENRTTYGCQIYIPRNRHGFWKRHMWNGSWTKWDKIQSLMNVTFPNSHTISANNTYEKVPLGTISDYRGDNAVIANEDDTFSFRYNDGGAIKITVSGRINPTNTNTKYIKVTKNGSDVRMYQLSNISGLNSFTLVAPARVTNSNDKFAIEVYGSVGDIFSQLMAVFE